MIVTALAVATVSASVFAQPASRTVVIRATDYAFQFPANMPAGRTTFVLENTGKVRHELNITLLKPGVSIDTFMKTVRANETTQSLIVGPVGVLFAKPGERSAAGLTVDLKTGQQYAAICIFRDSAKAPRHYDMGMYSLLTVGSGREKPARASMVPTDTIVGTDYAYQYPRTLSPGRHRFAFRNDGKMRHELSFILLKPGVTLQKMQETEKAGGDVDSLIDKDLGLLHSRGGSRPVGVLEFDLLPGREYVIACFFKDDDKAPEHYTLGMFGNIRVSGNAAQ
ncbi:MAG TPA: hypothetical protein VHM24_04445 [Gemmatimonadaceae bacterium]|nr:hypothetical protein [Gemmatimonadaceae bacterium]